MEQGVLFIDGGHLTHAWPDHMLGGRIDFLKLEAWCFQEAEILKGPVPSHYYDGVPTSSGLAAKKHKFLTALKYRGFQVQHRPLWWTQCRGCGLNRYHQKGIDTLLTTDMIECAWRHPEITIFLILTGDFDMAPPMTCLRERHARRVILLHCDEGDRTNYDNVESAADRTIKIQHEDLRSCLL